MYLSIAIDRVKNILNQQMINVKLFQNFNVIKMKKGMKVRVALWLCSWGCWECSSLDKRTWELAGTSKDASGVSANEKLNKIYFFLIIILWIFSLTEIAPLRKGKWKGEGEREGGKWGKGERKKEKRKREKGNGDREKEKGKGKRGKGKEKGERERKKGKGEIRKEFYL